MPKERKLTKAGVARKDAGSSKGGKGSRSFTGETVSIAGEYIKVRVRPLKSKANFIKSGRDLELKFKSGKKATLIEDGSKLKALTKRRVIRLKKEGVVVR